MNNKPFLRKNAVSYLSIGVIIGALTGTNAIADTIITQRVYEGKLGNTAIVLQTLETPNKEKMAAGYFYKSQRVNIALLPVSKGPLSLLEYPSDCTYSFDSCTATAKISLRDAGSKNDKFTGQWSSLNNTKTYPITLTQISERRFNYEGTIKNDEDLLSIYNDDMEDPKLNPYLSHQTSGQMLFSEGENIIGAYGYKVATDNVTGVHYPVLSSSKNKINLNNINEALNAQRSRMVGYALECKARTNKDSFWNQYGDWQDYGSTPAYATDKVLVIEEGGSTFCGGAHPNNSFSHRIFEIATGKEISGADLFKIYTSDEYDKEKKPQFEALYNKMKTQKKYFHPEVSELDDEMTKECFDDESWMPLAMWPDKNGVVFSLEDVPHVMGACMGNYYVVPYKEMLPFMTPLAKQLFAKEIAASK